MTKEYVQAEAEAGDTCPCCGREYEPGQVAWCEGYSTPLWCQVACLPDKGAGADLVYDSVEGNN